MVPGNAEGWKRLTGSSTSNMAVYSAGQKRFEIGSFALTTEGANTAALLHGVGTTTTPAQMNTANKNFIGYWVKSAATSGDTRGMYIRLYLSAAGSGEALRAYTTCDAANVATGGTANGAHISLDIVGSGTISGAANALRTTIDVGANLTPGGTLASLQCDSNFAAGVTLPGTAAFIRFTNTGATAMARLFEVPTVASGGLFAAHTTQTMTHSLRIYSAAGTLYYIMCTDAATNRTGGA